MEEKVIVIDNKETRYTINTLGQVKNLETGKYLKGTFARNEYHTFYLMLEGKQHCLMGHRLVAMAFLENDDPINKIIVHHKDEDKHNNRIENLEWVTTSANVKATERKQSPLGEKIEVNDEEWKSIPNFPSYLINREGKVIKKKTNRLLVQGERCGYLRVRLVSEDEKVSLKSVHRLVYETFIGEIPEGSVIDHIDGDKANNNLANLRLSSQSENMYNAFKNGHKGQKPIYQYSKDNKFIKKYDSIQAAADDMNVTHAAIRSAAARKGTSCGYRWYYEEF